MRPATALTGPDRLIGVAKAGQRVDAADERGHTGIVTYGPDVGEPGLWRPPKLQDCF